MDAADRQWIRRQLLAMRRKVKLDTEEILSDVLTREAQLIVLERMRKRPEVVE